MAQKTLLEVTLELEAGNAAIVDLGKMLGPAAISIRDVKAQYDAATAGQRGDIVPVVVTVFEDRSFALRMKTPPTAFLIRQATGRKGSAKPGHESAGVLTRAQLRAIAERKLPDLNTGDLDKAMKTIAGTARSMGVRVE